MPRTSFPELMTIADPDWYILIIIFRYPLQPILD